MKDYRNIILIPEMLYIIFKTLYYLVLVNLTWKKLTYFFNYSKVSKDASILMSNNEICYSFIFLY